MWKSLKILFAFLALTQVTACFFGNGEPYGNPRGPIGAGGGGGVSIAQTYEQPSEVVKWMYSDAQRLSEFEGMAVEANVVKWLLEHAKVEDKAIGFDELMGRTGAQA